jgi:KTSC domain-containing protein
MTFPTRLIRLPKPRRSVARSDESLPVVSAAISRIEYNRETQELTFTTARDGVQYTISGISEIEAHRWANAESPGAYFNRHVRGRY